MIYDADGNVKADAPDLLLNNDAERIKRVKKDSDATGFNNGYKKAQGEVLTDFETGFKAKYNYHSDLKGLDLIDDYVAKQQKTSVTTDDVRKHPAYLELERNSVKKEEYNRVVNDFDAFRQKLERDSVMDKIHKMALSVLDKSGAIIEDNPTVAANRRKHFLDEFNDYEYEFDGEFITPMKDGKRIQDKQGHPLDFTAVVKDAIERNFVVSQQTYRQSSQNTNGSNITVPVPRNKEEYAKMLKDAEGDSKKRVAIMEAWKASQK